MLETVSLIIPVFNEEKYMKNFLKSVLEQDYDFSKVEVIFIDGASTDNTKKIIDENLSNKKITYKILNNLKRITPVSLNIGIKEAQKDIIIRLDAHSIYPQNYITKCVYYLNKTGADNVGCIVKTKSEGKIGNAIAEVLSSKFGVGNSKFRTETKSGYVDTVPFGTFRKSLFDKIGYFDEELTRSEDNEFNYRIIKNGGKVYLFTDIEVIYHPRNTITKLIKMGYENGKGIMYTAYKVPGAMKIRHFIPLVFVLGLIIGLLIMLFKLRYINIAFLIVIFLYLLIDGIFTTKSILKNDTSQILCFFIYPIFHISYGIGSMVEIGKIIFLKWRKN